MEAHVSFENLMVKTIRRFPLKNGGEYLLVNLMGIKPQKNGSYFKMSITVWPEEQKMFQYIKEGSIISGIAEMSTYPVSSGDQINFVLRSVWFSAGQNHQSQNHGKEEKEPKNKESEKKQEDSEKEKLMDLVNILNTCPFD